jgi:RNA polymerase-interacting CarD/CdnL/TRCF family regulator
VVALERRDVGGAACDCLVVDLVRGLRDTLSVEGAAERLRAVATKSDLDRVGEVLAAEPGDREGPWTRRLQEGKSKIAGGCVTALAELVRDGALVELRGNRVRLSDGERRLYLQARELLAQEIAWVRGLEREEVEAWIDARIRESS